jgi:hypothetical protein
MAWTVPASLAGELPHVPNYLPGYFLNLNLIFFHLKKITD